MPPPRPFERISPASLEDVATGTAGAAGNAQSGDGDSNSASSLNAGGGGGDGGGSPLEAPALSAELRSAVGGVKPTGGGSIGDELGSCLPSACSGPGASWSGMLAAGRGGGGCYGAALPGMRSGPALALQLCGGGALRGGRMTAMGNGHAGSPAPVPFGSRPQPSAEGGPTVAAAPPPAAVHMPCAAWPGYWPPRPPPYPYPNPGAPPPPPHLYGAYPPHMPHPYPPCHMPYGPYPPKPYGCPPYGYYPRAMPHRRPPPAAAGFGNNDAEAAEAAKPAFVVVQGPHAWSDCDGGAAAAGAYAYGSTPSTAGGVVPGSGLATQPGGTSGAAADSPPFLLGEAASSPALSSGEVLAAAAAAMAAEAEVDSLILDPAWYADVWGEANADTGQPAEGSKGEGASGSAGA